MEILKNFLYEACGCKPEWTPVNIITDAVERIREQVGDAKGHLRALRRGRLGDGGDARPQGHRRQPDVRLRRPRPPQAQRGRAGRRGVRRELGRAARPRGLLGTFPGQARRRHGPRGEAQDHRRGVHPHLRGGGRQARGRQIPGAGHALFRRDRERDARRRQDKEPPQRGRAARGDGPRPRRAS